MMTMMAIQVKDYTHRFVTSTRSSRVTANNLSRWFCFISSVIPWLKYAKPRFPGETGLSTFNGNKYETNKGSFQKTRTKRGSQKNEKGVRVGRARYVWKSSYQKKEISTLSRERFGTELVKTGEDQKRGSETNGEGNIHRGPGCEGKSRLSVSACKEKGETNVSTTGLFCGFWVWVPVRRRLIIWVWVRRRSIICRIWVRS